MDEFDLHANSIDDVYAYGAKYVLIWACVFNDECGRDLPIFEKIRAVDMEDIPTCILFINENDNPWVREEMLSWDENPPIIFSYCGGLAISVIKDMNDFPQEVLISKDMGKQILAAIARFESEKKHKN